MPVSRPSGLPERATDPARPTLSEVARGAGDIATTLERGQAEQPLAALARDLTGAPPPPLSLTLLATTPAARNAALQWLVGPHHALVQVDAETLDVVEIHLQQHGFAIDCQPGARRTYATAEEFGNALRDSLPAFAADPHASTEALVLTVASARPVSDLSITVLPAPERIAALGSLPARLASRHALLVVVAPEAHTFGDAEKAALDLLLPLSCAVWPVLIPPCGGDADRAVRNWGLVASRTAPLLAPCVLADHDTPLPEFLMLSPAQPLAEALHQAARVRAAASLVDMLTERFDHDLAQLRSRLKREQRLEKSAEGVGGDAAARATLDQIKLRANEDFSSLVLALRETQRRTQLETGAIGALLSELSASVQPADLLREEAGKSTRLTLDRGFGDQARQRFAKGARRLLDEHCVVIRDSFDLIRRRTEAALRETGARTLSVPLALPDNAALWETLRDVVRLDPKYRGELPRRGFLQRLGAGRQMVFGVLMVLSLVGGLMGFNVRRLAFAGILLLMLFIGAVIWTFHSWKLQDADAMEREMEKVREGVLAELQRLGAEVSRDMQSRLLECIDAARRDFLAAFEAATREWQAEATSLSDTERKEARARVKLIEQRDKDMQPLGLQLTKLRTQIAQVSGDAQSTLQSAARPAPGASA